MSMRDCPAVPVLASVSEQAPEFLSPRSQIPDVSRDTLTERVFFTLF